MRSITPTQGRTARAGSRDLRPHRLERRVRRVGLASLALCLLAACGRPPGEIFPAPRTPLRWPAPPEPARIAYVGELVTSADLKPGRSFLEGMGDAMFGGPAVQSMLSPFGVTTDGGERVFVADTNAQAVHVFNLKNRRYASWTPEARGLAFAQPVGVTYAQDHLYVTDSVAGVIFVFDDDGNCLGVLGEGLLQRPAGIAASAETDRLFVVDTTAHAVMILSLDGVLQQRLGGRGTALGRFNFPTHVALDSDGRLYVADTLNFRVQVFDPDLQPIRQIGDHGDVPGAFSQPKGIAIDGAGHLYVVDAHFENVQVFDREGKLLLDFGGEGRGPGLFWLPAGIHVDGASRIWIADTYNRRVQVFEYLPEVTP